MSEPTISINCYTIRDYCTNPTDFAESMKKLAAIGYQSVQISGVKGCTPQEILDITKANQLDISAAHIGMSDFKNDFETQVEKLKLWNCKYVALPVAPDEYRKMKAPGFSLPKRLLLLARNWLHMVSPCAITTTVLNSCVSVTAMHSTLFMMRVYRNTCRVKSTRIGSSTVAVLLQPILKSSMGVNPSFTTRI